LGYANAYPKPCDGVMKKLLAMHWTLIGFPCDTGSNGVDDLLGDALGTYGTDWVLYEQTGNDDYIGGNTQKRQLASTDPVTPTKGYWIIAASDKNMSIDTTLSGLAHTSKQAASTFNISDSAFDDLNLTTLPDSNTSSDKKIMLGNPFQHKMQLSELYFSHAGTGDGYNPMSSASSSPNADYIRSSVYTFDYNGTSADNYVAVSPDTPGFNDTLKLGVGFFVILKSGSSGENNITFPLEK
jgi:hypothetical protein